MNTRIKNIITYGPVTVAFVVFLFFVIRGFILKRSDLEHLYSHAFNGKITKFKDLHRTTLKIWLDNPDTSFSITGFAQYKDTLTVGDSLFKDEKSYVIYYYKRKPDSSFYLYDTFTAYSRLF